jgi:hypothetical protein
MPAVWSLTAGARRRTAGRGRFQPLYRHSALSHQQAAAAYGIFIRNYSIHNYFHWNFPQKRNM